MCSEWKLPADLSDLITDHHDDDREEHSSAHVVAGWDLAGGVDLREQVVLRAQGMVNLDEASVDAAINSALADAHSIAELFY